MLYCGWQDHLLVAVLGLAFGWIVCDLIHFVKRIEIKPGDNKKP